MKHLSLGDTRENTTVYDDGGEPKALWYGTREEAESVVAAVNWFGSEKRAADAARAVSTHDDLVLELRLMMARYEGTAEGAGIPVEKIAVNTADARAVLDRARKEG